MEKPIKNVKDVHNYSFCQWMSRMCTVKVVFDVRAPLLCNIIMMMHFFSSYIIDQSWCVLYICTIVMLIPSITLFVLISSVGSSATITLDSVIITQVQDTIAPKENSNAYVVTSINSRQGFFIDTGSTNNITLQLISIYPQQVQSTSKPPQNGSTLQHRFTWLVNRP